MSSRDPADRAPGGGRRVVLVALGREPAGAETVLVRQAAAFAGRGWDVRVLVRGDPAPERLTVALDRHGLSWNSVAGWGPTLTWRLALAVRALGPDVVHVHAGWPAAGVPAIAGARLGGARHVVVTEHLGLRIGGRRLLARRLANRVVDTFVAVSPDVERRLVELGWPADRVTIVPNGVDPPLPGSAAATEARATEPGATPAGTPPAGLPEGDGPLVVGIGRLVAAKGWADLVDAVATLPRTRLAIAGAGPLRADLESRIRAAGLADRAALLGWRDDVGALLAAGTIVAIPSHVEGLPLVLLEALAHGRPVVAAAIPGIADVVEHGVHALLVPPGDPAALASAIARLATDPGLAASLGRAGAELVAERYGVDAAVEAVEEIYRRLLDGAAGPASPGRSTDWRFALALAQLPSDRPSDRRGGSGTSVLTFRRPRRPPDRVARSLRRRGLVVDAVLAAWPGPETARWWVPVGPGAPRAAAKASGPRPQVRGRRWLSWLAWGARLRAGLAPVVVLAHAGSDEPRGVPALGPSGYLSRAIGPGWQLLGLRTAGSRGTNRVVALVERDAERLVVKVPRSPGLSSAAEREAKVLAALESRAGRRVDGVPRVVAVDDVPSVGLVVAQTALEGDPPAGLARPGNAIRLARRVAAVIEAVARATRDDGEAARAARRAATSERLERFRAAYAPVIPADRYRRFAAALAPLDGLPCVMEHRDLGPWNLLEAGDGRIGIVDWESAVVEGWPGLDLAYLLDHLALAVARGPDRRRQALVDVRSGDGAFGGLARDLIEAHLRALGVDPVVLPALRALAAAIHAVSEADRLIADARATQAELGSASWLQVWELDMTALETT